MVNSSSSSIDGALLKLAEELERVHQRVALPPSTWIGKNFYIPEPRDPETDELFPPGPMRLAWHQALIVDEAFRRDADGYFIYNTILYSAPKKSGKSAIAAAVATYMADTEKYAKIYCLANDGKGAEDRIFNPICTCIDLHQTLGGPLATVSYTRTKMSFPNTYAGIEAIPCDAKGEAGAEPTLTVWSELWGFDTPSKEKLWTELTIPPTRFGRALRWVESYAGFSGQSTILEQLYEQGVLKGEPHPYLNLELGLPVFVNGGMLTYWDTQPRMAWQTPEYYVEQAKTMIASEFNRVHKNQWQYPKVVFVTEEILNRVVKDDYPVELPIGSRVPVVLAIDVGLKSDTSTVLATTRHPNYEKEIAVRSIANFNPAEIGEIQITSTVEKTIRLWCEWWNVVCVAYDEWQAAKLAQDLRREGIAWFRQFPQQSLRWIADKHLYDLIIKRELHINPHLPNYSILRQHLLDARAETSKIEGQLRLVKAKEDQKIDAAVTLSMAAWVCQELNLDNKHKE